MQQPSIYYENRQWVAEWRTGEKVFARDLRTLEDFLDSLKTRKPLTGRQVDNIATVVAVVVAVTILVAVTVAAALLWS